MLKVTCIIGSASDDGSTAYLIDKFISGLSGKAIVKRYVMGKINLKFCLGCKQCYNDGKCVQDDDVKDIVTDILDSDYVVIAAPSYWADVPGQLKTFFDRNTPYGDTNPNRILKAGKNIKGIAIAVRAGTRPAENELLLNAIEHYYGHLGIEPIKRISICSTNTLQDLINNHQKEIQEVYSIGQNIVS